MQFNDYDKTSLEESSSLLRAVAHKLRISIINYIFDTQPVDVNSIHTELDLEQSITSQHLKILRESNVVKTTRIGKQIYYEINESKVLHTLKNVQSFDKISLAHRKKK
jgi:DNA-binding transcriptional ArsR family regulator